jgi:hypothetical protein
MTGNPLPDRSLVRAEFAQLLTDNLVGAGKLVQAVYGYTAKDFGGASPVLVVGSAGTEDVQFGGSGSGSYPNFLIDLWSFVLYADVKENGELTTVDDVPLAEGGVPVWSEQDSEQALDLIEAGVRQFINALHGVTWDKIEYAGATAADIVSVGDASYRRELFTLRFRTM